MRVEGPPIGDDDIMVLGDSGCREGPLVRDAARELEHLSGDEPAFLSSIDSFTHSAEFSDGYLYILKGHTELECHGVEQHFGSKWNGDGSEHG